MSEVSLENLYKLVSFQVWILDKLSSGRVSRDEWHELVGAILLACGGERGRGSGKLWQALDIMTKYELYQDPMYVKQLYHMLIREFPEAVGFYVLRGWVKPSPPERPLTTIQQPRRLEQAFRNPWEEGEG